MKDSIFFGPLVEKKLDPHELRLIVPLFHLPVKGWLPGRLGGKININRAVSIHKNSSRQVTLYRRVVGFGRLTVITAKVDKSYGVTEDSVRTRKFSKEVKKVATGRDGLIKIRKSRKRSRPAVLIISLRGRALSFGSGRG